MVLRMAMQLTLQGAKLAEEYGIPFFETSAKADINVEKGFLAIARDVSQGGAKPASGTMSRAACLMGSVVCAVLANVYRSRAGCFPATRAAPRRALSSLAVPPPPSRSRVVAARSQRRRDAGRLYTQHPHHSSLRPVLRKPPPQPRPIALSCMSVLMPALFAKPALRRTLEEGELSLSVE